MTAWLSDNFFGLFNYWIVIVLMMTGFYTVISHDNMVKKLIGLNVFQTSVFIFYISMGKIRGDTAPIITGGHPVYAHPLPQVLILTAIVVGVSTTALGLALVVRIHEAYGSIEEDDVLKADFQTGDNENPARGGDALPNTSQFGDTLGSEDHSDRHVTGGRKNRP